MSFIKIVFIACNVCSLFTMENPKCGNNTVQRQNLFELTLRSRLEDEGLYLIYDIIDFNPRN